MNTPSENVAGGLDRRQVLAAAALATPAIVLTTSIPAHATSANSVLELALSATGIGAGAPVDVTATVLDSRGEPWAGQVVTFTTGDSTVLSFSSSSAVTDSAGRATVSVSAASDAAAGTRSITATSGPLSRSATLDVIAVSAEVGTLANPWAISISPTADFALVSTRALSAFSRVSTITDAVVADIPTSETTSGFAISDGGDFALVANWPGLIRLDTLTNSIVSEIPIAGCLWPAISHGGDFAYVSSQPGATAGVLSRIDVPSNSISGTVDIPSPKYPSMIAMSPDDSFIYVTDWLYGKLYRVSTATNTLVATTSISNTLGVAISPDGSFAYVTARDGFVHRVDTSTNAVVASISTPGDAVGIAISSDGSFAYSAHPDANVVRRIDTATNTVTATVPVSGRPLFVAISPDDSFAYVTRNTAASVARIEWD